MSLSDLAPTLVHAAGLKIDGPSANLLAPQLAERDVYAETQYPIAAGWHPLTALVGERWKLVRAADAQLYDLSSDPGETKNVAGRTAGVVQGMIARLTAMAAAKPAAPSAPPPRTPPSAFARWDTSVVRQHRRVEPACAESVARH